MFLFVLEIEGGMHWRLVEYVGRWGIVNQKFQGGSTQSWSFLLRDFGRACWFALCRGSQLGGLGLSDKFWGWFDRHSWFLFNALLILRLT